MANEEHLAILRQGVEAWNAWRRENKEARPDFSGATLSGADLRQADLSEADLSEADLSEANLSEANLTGANLSSVRLVKANLNSVRLITTDLSGADLREADLSSAHLIRADLSGADLSGADLSGAILRSTAFGSVDLRIVKGLDRVQHTGPSRLDIDTLYLSEGQIPEAFLRGCGVPDSLIEYLPSLIGATKPIQYYSCFISYSSANEEFARRLHGRMQQASLRVWFAPHDLKGGHKLYDQIDEAIRIYDKLIIVLSEASIRSGWVETELRKAFQKERREKRRTLFPIGLVDYATLEGWRLPDSSSGKDLAEVVRGYFVPDFSQWKEHDAFEAAFARLLTDLKVSTEAR